MIRRPSVRRAHDDAGVTLIETVIYVSLLSVVAMIVGSMLMTNAKASKQVGTSSLASSIGQNIANSIAAGVRNADWASTPTTGTTQFLTVHTATNAATVSWKCQAWYFDSTHGGAIYTKVSSAKISAPSGSLTGWTQLASGVTPISGTPVLSGSSSVINLALNVTSGASGSVMIRTSAGLRSTSTGTNTCQ